MPLLQLLIVAAWPQLLLGVRQSTHLKPKKFKNKGVAFKSNEQFDFNHKDQTKTEKCVPNQDNTIPFPLETFPKLSSDNKIYFGGDGDVDVWMAFEQQGQRFIVRKDKGNDMDSIIQMIDKTEVDHQQDVRQRTNALGLDGYDDSAAGKTLKADVHTRWMNKQCHSKDVDLLKALKLHKITEGSGSEKYYGFSIGRGEPDNTQGYPVPTLTPKTREGSSWVKHPFGFTVNVKTETHQPNSYPSPGWMQNAGTGKEALQELVDNFKNAFTFLKCLWSRDYVLGVRNARLAFQFDEHFKLKVFDWSRLHTKTDVGYEADQTLVSSMCQAAGWAAGQFMNAPGNHTDEIVAACQVVAEPENKHFVSSMTKIVDLLKKYPDSPAKVVNDIMEIKKRVVDKTEEVNVFRVKSNAWCENPANMVDEKYVSECHEDKYIVKGEVMKAVADGWTESLQHKVEKESDHDAAK